VLPDVGAIVALAAPDDNPYWLGLVTWLTCTKVFVRWLDKDDQGIWSVASTSEEGQAMSTLIAHDVSLSVVLDGTMHPELHQQLIHAQQHWDEELTDADTEMATKEVPLPPQIIMYAYVTIKTHFMLI
jgi:hypothetical protein